MLDDLHQMFQEDFITLKANGDNTFQNIIAGFGKRLREDPAKAIEASHCTSADLYAKETLGYEGLLSYVRAEMVEMIAVRFGQLGCELRDRGDRRFYLSGLLRDQAVTMFDREYVGNNPLQHFNNHLVFQLVDTWFSFHPLSPIISKTILLTSIKSNTVDEALLATILADAVSVHGQLSNSPESEQQLLDFAKTSLRRRPARKWDIPSTQALVLVGWREMCMGNVKRATCWLGYAGRGITELHVQMKRGKNTDQQRMNGVGLSVVADEIVCCLYWVVFSTTFWALMQIDAPFSLILPKSQSFDFPPINESSAEMMKLDIASNNISTLLAQARTLRELWPMAQIAALTTHICALDPGPSSTDECLEHMAWQSRHLHKLQRLLAGHSAISPVCSKVVLILQEAFQDAEKEGYECSLQPMVLCAYRTLIIQLLFPRGRSGDAPVPITSALVEDVCYSVEEVLGSARTIVSSQISLSFFHNDASGARTIAETLALGLDACGRALAYIHGRALAGTKAEYVIVAERKDVFATYAEKLHKVSKEPIPWNSILIRPIKRRLKDVKFAFSSWGQGADTSAQADRTPNENAPQSTTQPPPSGRVPEGSNSTSKGSAGFPSLEFSSRTGSTVDATPSNYLTPNIISPEQHFNLTQALSDPVLSDSGLVKLGNLTGPISEADMSMLGLCKMNSPTMPMANDGTPMIDNQPVDTSQQAMMPGAPPAANFPGSHDYSHANLYDFGNEEMGFW